MLLHEPGCEPIMGDNAIDDEDELESNLDPSGGADDNDLPATHETRDDVISVISQANSTKSNKSKKRVQFLPDGILVRVREIPPRSNKSSSSSDGSASDTDSDSDSDSETGTESEETSTSDRDTPSPAVQTVSETQFTTMPPLVWNPSQAKGPYAVNKQNTRSTSVVAKITGIHRPTSPSNATKAATKKVRRTPSPKQDNKRLKKPQPRQNEKSGGGKLSPDDSKRPKPVKKKMPLKKEGKLSPPPPSKQSKGPQATKASIPSKPTLAQRRISSAPIAKFSPSKKNQKSTVSTSVTLLPSSSKPTPTTDVYMDRVGRAMQSLNMGKLYTIDGFIFPTHQVTDNLHLPDLHHGSKPEDDFFFVNGRRGSSEDPGSTSPRRDFSPTGKHTQSQMLSPTSANRKRRYAWQMANGSIQNTLQNTPSIAQMWDNVPHSSLCHVSSSVSSSHDAYYPGKPGSGSYPSKGKS
ncbi:myb-like protein U [Aplysia californica]|uniref:Myb-like protein U n=1 Tax=Aplysia californica TaxID=6500 RepID=A0ABM0JBY5_APLCA|nr:myb-like protein U [Aplysia californica]